jgi:hypothetical protein
MPEEPYRAVLDTSALVPVWSRLLLTDLAATRPSVYVPIWCEWIIAETWRVLAVKYVRRHPNFGSADEAGLSVSANAMLTALLQVMEMITVVPPFIAAWADARDVNDVPIWNAALRSGAQFVISHNVRDFPPRNADGLCMHEGIEFITVENFVGDVLDLDLAAVAVIPIPPGGRLGHQRRMR